MALFTDTRKMELINVFDGDELVYERTVAFQYMTTIPEDILDKAIEWHEGKEAELETALLKDWYDTAYNEDQAMEMCKELWRIRFRLQYLREAFYGFPPTEEDIVAGYEADDDTKAAEMTDDEMAMEDLTQCMAGTKLAENWSRPGQGTQ